MKAKRGRTAIPTQRPSLQRMGKRQSITTPFVLMMTIGSNSLTNRERPSLMNGVPPRKPKITNKPPIGRKNCKMKGLGLSNHSCPNSRNLSQTVFLRSPSRMIHHQDFPRPSWEVAILKLETKAVGRNDCQSMQSIPRLDLSTQILVLHHRFGNRKHYF